MKILCDKNNCQVNNLYAQNLLLSFVKDVPTLYSLKFMTCNFHYLLHMHEDAKKFGSIQATSAFKYENHLQKIKKTNHKVY